MCRGIRALPVMLPALREAYLLRKKTSCAVSHMGSTVPPVSALLLLLSVECSSRNPSARLCHDLHHARAVIAISLWYQVTSYLHTHCSVIWYVLVAYPGRTGRNSAIFGRMLNAFLCADLQLRPLRQLGCFRVWRSATKSSPFRKSPLGNRGNSG